MDFLNPKKQRQHTTLLLTGYVLIAIAIFFATRLLFYESSGFGLNKNGQLIQNGLLFVSSTPGGANIDLNGTNNTNKTNARLSLVSGDYMMKIQKNGYRSWQRSISLDGGTVAHYDYPFLFPTTLSTADGPTYSEAPGLVTQSPDLRWLLVEKSAANSAFDLYDTSNPKLKAVALQLPEAITNVIKLSTLQVVEWSTDNQHVLLKTTDDAGAVSFIMFDRASPDNSVLLNSALGINPTKITLFNGKYNQYYVFNAAAQTVATYTLGDQTAKPLLDHVLSYESFASSSLLYVSDEGASTGKISINLFQNNKSYALRTSPANDTYFMELAQYGGSTYVAVGASKENKVYVYKNPVGQLTSNTALLVPIYVLKTLAPDYVAFSANNRFVMSENGSGFSVYDAEIDKGYSYDTKTSLDAPQIHATWMDGHRLEYVHAGKLFVFDFDGMNQQTLMAASPAYTPAYDSNYKFVDTFVPSVGSTTALKMTTTQLRTAQDQ